MKHTLKFMKAEKLLFAISQVLRVLYGLKTVSGLSLYCKEKRKDSSSILSTTTSSNEPEGEPWIQICCLITLRPGKNLLPESQGESERMSAISQWHAITRKDGILSSQAFMHLLAICEGKNDFIPDMESRVQFTNKDFAEFILKRHEIAMNIHRNPGSLYYGSLIYKTPVISNIKKDGDITYNSLAKTAKILNETPLTLYLMVKAMKVHDILITSKTMLGFYEPYFKVVQDLGRGRKAEAK